LILAAVGKGKEVFLETFSTSQGHLENGISWYYMK